MGLALVERTAGARLAVAWFDDYLALALGTLRRGAEPREAGTPQGAAATLSLRLALGEAVAVRRTVHFRPLAHHSRAIYLCNTTSNIVYTKRPFKVSSSNR